VLCVDTERFERGNDAAPLLVNTDGIDGQVFDTATRAARDAINAATGAAAPAAGGCVIACCWQCKIADL
jgi:hypothetical protein